MAQPIDPSVFTPDALADESLFDDDEPLTRPGIAAPRVVPPRSGNVGKTPKQIPRTRPAHDPDAEAIKIAAKVVQKVAVARSLAKIAGSVLRSYADRKMVEMVESDAGNALAHVERARRMANAAREAAKHAASLAAARATARAQDFARDASSLIDSLDHEDAHDDAC